MENIIYRLFDKNKDIPNFLALFELVYKFPINVDYFKWKFEKNPGGLCYMLVAEEREKGIIGFASLTPYKFWISGQQRLAAQGVDTMVHPEFRKKGIFTTLTRKLLEYLHDNKLCFRYSAPGLLSYPGYIKLGSRKICRMPHMFRLNIINKIFKNKIALRDTSIKETSEIFKKGVLSLRLITKADQRFDALNIATASLAPIRVQKDSGFINWRYLDNPIKPCKILGFFKNEELLGYAAIRGGYLVDILYGQDEEHIELFIKSAINYFDTKGTIMIETWFSGDSRIEKILRRKGFIVYWGKGLRKLLAMVDDYPLIAYVNESECNPSMVSKPDNWYITMGDIDCM